MSNEAVSIEEVISHTDEHLDEVVRELKAEEFEESLSTMFTTLSTLVFLNDYCQQFLNFFY